MARQNITHHKQQLGTERAATRVVFPRMNRVRLLCIDHLAAANDTENAEVVTFGFLDGAQEYKLRTCVTTKAGEVVFCKGKLWVPGHFQPFAEFVLADEGDVLHLWVYGYAIDEAGTRVGPNSAVL